MRKRLFSFLRAGPLDRWADPSPALRQVTHAAALAVLVAASAEALLRSHSPLQAFVAACTQAFIVLLLLIVTFIWKRLRSPRAQYRVVLVACLVLLPLSVIDVVRGMDGRQQRQVYGDALKLTQQRLETALRTADWRKMPEVDAAPQASGAFGEYERLARSLIGRALDRQRDYARALEALDLTRALAPASLAANVGVDRAGEQLRQAHTLASRHRDGWLKDLDDGTALAGQLRLPRAERDRLQELLGEQAARQRGAVEQSWQADARYLEQAQAIVALLDRTQGRWRLDEQAGLRFQDAFAQELYDDWRTRLAELDETSQTQRLAPLQQLAASQAWPLL